MTVDKNFRFNYGKHKGKSVGELLEEDPQYLIWTTVNCSWFNLQPEILASLQSRPPSLRQTHKLFDPTHFIEAIAQWDDGHEGP
jgi:hypothetical protein